MPTVAGARCTILIAVPTLTSSPSQNGSSALEPAASIMPIMLGVEYTGGRCSFQEVSVFLNWTVVSASPRVPRGTGLAMLGGYREQPEKQKQPRIAFMTRTKSSPVRSTPLDLA